MIISKIIYGRKDKMNIRVLYNVVLVRLGIRRVLPGDYVLAFPVEECGEELVEVPVHGNIILDSRMNTGKIFLRKTVVEKLIRIADRVGKGQCLLLHSAYRTLEEQHERWERARRLAGAAHPGATPEELRVLGGAHQTGAAVDVEICRRSGIPEKVCQLIDYGTIYGEHTPETLTHSKGISRKARLNRKALCRLMRSEGFVNYPGEWWHFSYGDRMWAAYAHRKKAVYDTVVEKG